MIGDNNKVSITVNTTYPFGLSLTYTIDSSQPFEFGIRIPEWVSNYRITPRIVGRSTNEKRSLPNSRIQKVPITTKGPSVFMITFTTEPRVEILPNNTAAIYYGALLYSLAIEFSEKEIPPLHFRNQTPLPNNTTKSHTHDHILEPTSIWNVAIDPSQIKIVDSETLTLPNPIWALGHPPVELRIAAVEIEWPIAYDTPANPPASPKIIGKPFVARFVPYGSAKLHMAHLPVVSLSKVNL